MPMVNGKKFPYTGKGMMDAAAEKKKPMPGSSAKKDALRKAIMPNKKKSKPPMGMGM
jgi:hypothetical protein